MPWLVPLEAWNMDDVFIVISAAVLEDETG